MSPPMKCRKERQGKIVNKRQEKLKRQIQTRRTTSLTYHEDAEYSSSPAQYDFTLHHTYDDDRSHMMYISSSNPLQSSQGYDNYRSRSPQSPHTLDINQSYSYDAANPPSLIRPVPVRPWQSQYRTPDY
eukprot:CAMPEP_0172485154 /NCGR_PEP_ID=MMETSP1066-20121228/13013_1 /TAXON_ID=671091 /ORGANISM="Coscinodiscus wailesii, Strain CCMP2513" /LENGTH=128 /DNA_ID=CAMNT_0013250171 /DNA_START=345 /DNA_END=728 /DNA_ORIENTATION=-